MAASVLGPAVALLARTWRVELVDQSHWATMVAQRRPFLFLLWHEALLPLLWHHRRQGVAILVSEARDGRYLAEFATRLGYRLLFGSSTRGGARALLQAVRAVEAGIPVAITPDGPQGPRRVMKPGILAAAERGGAVVLPIHAEAERAWRLRSWDRFMIPKPFSRVRIGYGPPLAVPEGSSGTEVMMTEAASALNRIEERIAWPPVGATATA
jgi:lysophospholipid acyltransferase (LPLAT)-like uncharacterized protein